MTAAFFPARGQILVTIIMMPLKLLCLKDGHCMSRSGRGRLRLWGKIALLLLRVERVWLEFFLSLPHSLGIAVGMYSNVHV